MARDMGERGGDALPDERNKRVISSVEAGEQLPPPEKVLPLQREKARQRIAYVVVGAYIFLVVLNLALPFYIYAQKGAPSEVLSIRDVKDLIQAISGVLSGFVSMLGFVVGYDFKAAEEVVARQQQEVGERMQRA